MAIFLLDPTYPENEDQQAEFAKRLNTLASELFTDLAIEEVDAGPSASIPGWAISVGAVGWFIFSAPATISENLPLWKSGFTKIVELASQLDLDFSIDLHDAAATAIFECSQQFSWNDSEIEIISCTRHSRNLNGISSNYILPTEILEPASWMEKHDEACKQLECRYTFLIRNSYDSATVLVDRKGRCEFAKML
ncbi:MAG: hypothetical protein ABL928_15140 [Sphingorhabdus sp.]